jgi:hypothetical protein
MLYMEDMEDNMEEGSDDNQLTKTKVKNLGVKNKWKLLKKLWKKGDKILN